MKFFVILFVTVAASSAYAVQPSDELIQALIKVESHGNDQAIGDKHLANKAYGCLQIRQPVCDDVNAFCGTSYKAEDCLGNRRLSIAICKIYIDIYATTKNCGKVTDEKMARMWNGGPKGFRSKRTYAYWVKVRKALGD
jgi:hypothetical protein